MPDEPALNLQRPHTHRQMRRPGAQLPGPRQLLGWVYLGRLATVAAFLLRAFWGAQLHPQARLAAVLLLVVGCLATASAFWYTHRLNRRPGVNFIYSQVVLDVVLLTAMVYLSGAQHSVFAPLYILVICAAALLLPMLGGILIGMLAIVLYFASVWTAHGDLEGTALLQIALFAVVALVTGYVGDRLRQTGDALGEVQTELRQLRLDTGDILSTISTGVLTVDSEGRLAYLNPAAEEILSLSAARWLGKPVLEKLDRIAPGLGELIRHTASERHPIRRSETDPITEDGFVLGVSTTLVEGPNTMTPAVTAIFQDITEKKRVEALRRRAERLEAVAELSASLAHEIKNPLASIRSAVEQIGGESVDPEDGALLKRLVLRESDRLSRLLTEFIDFARVKVVAPEPVDFAAVVGQVVDLVRAHPDARGRDVHLRVELPAERAWLSGAEDLLHRAVLNLVLNGVQWAGPDGGVELALDEVRSDLLSPALGALSLIRLRVTDTGPGVPSDIVEHIFDPFFTRRPGGTGLGLALVQRAVEAHGGAIFVDSAPDDSRLGATFTLYLPALPPEAREPVLITPTEEPESL